ncbi:MAG: twin-arginine translocation signal domain-containing protein, partial [Thermoguttaceae bacterium]|nr:twin-arginine translocation signal domain-containing protein [Thermoguttaceae bacterium]
MMQHDRLARREFLKTAGAAAGAALAVPHLVPSGALAAAGAHEKLTFGFIGVGGMGNYHLGEILAWR